MKLKFLNVKGVIAMILFILLSVFVLRIDIPFIEEHGHFIWIGSCALYLWYILKYGTDTIIVGKEKNDV